MNTTGNNMRTYKRKKQDNQVIENVDQRCRLCLEKAEEPVPIFKDGEDSVAALSLRIMICVGIPIKQEELLPNIICINCVNNLEYYYKFRKKCETSFQRLNSHMDAVKHRAKLLKMVNEGAQYLKDNVEEAELIVIDTKNENINNMPEIQILEQTEESNGDLQTFLKSILLDLNIVVQTDDGLMIQDQDVSTYELETGDDDVITFELVEEDDDLAPTEKAEDVITRIKDESEDETEDVKVTEIKTKKKGWWCKICGKAFASSSTGIRHAAIHSGLRPYSCHTCGRNFAQKVVRDRHVLVHQDERPFPCVSCDKSFTQRAALAAHARLHARPRALRLHACPHCDKRFLYASGLSRHLFVHTGRAYSCGDCFRRFTDRSSLARHLRTKHADKMDNMIQLDT